MDAAIRVKVSHQSGLGHWVRQCHLARALKLRGWNVTLFPDAYDRLPGIAPPDLTITPVADEDSFLSQLPSGLPVVVLDVQDTEEAFVLRVRQSARRIAGFEDLGAGRRRLDLLIDCNLPPQPTRDLPAGVMALFGWDYSLLHPEYEQRAGVARQFPHGISSVLVSLGGTDPNGLTAPLTRTLVEHRPAVEVTVVAGPGFHNVETLQALQAQHSFRLLSPVQTLAELLATHDAVFCAGGVTLHEALATGTPAFVVAQAAHQAEKARDLEARGAARFLGLPGQWQPAQVNAALDTPPQVLDRQSAAGQKLIDGRGLSRIVDALSRLKSA